MKLGNRTMWGGTNGLRLWFVTGCSVVECDWGGTNQRIVGTFSTRWKARGWAKRQGLQSVTPIKDFIF